MSDFRAKLQPASFRGVKFFVEDTGMAFGRRVYRAEFPYRDKPFIDDMGKKARDYTVNAFLLETDDRSDLFKQRNALIDALEKSGPGTLIHPRLGALRVQVGSVNWRPKPYANVEMFSIEFLDAPSEPQPRVTADTLSNLLSAADRARDSHLSLFDKIAHFTRQADHVIDAARDDINRGMASVKQWTRLGTQISDSIAELSLSIDEALDNVGELILMPRTLAGNVSALFRQVLALPRNVKSVLNGYRNMEAQWGKVDTIPLTTASRLTQQANRTAIAQLFQASAAIEATRAVCLMASSTAVTSNAQSPFSSAAEALAVRDELLRELDAIAIHANDDAVYNAMVGLQAALSAHITTHGNALPNVSHVRHDNTLPILVIAHRLDGNIAREQDLISRNRIRHPAFVPAGTVLEVLRG